METLINPKEMNMNRKDIEQNTFQYYHSGFNCAEAILKAFVELLGKEPNPSITRFASGFGGGIGGSISETCGALTGGIIVLGWLFGRKDPSDDKQKVYTLSVELRSRFLQSFRATNCRMILDSLGVQENKLKCKKLTAETAGMLYDILRQENVLIGGADENHIPGQ
jgi:C_GCAxxG_C_C family probable redox protein